MYEEPKVTHDQIVNRICTMARIKPSPYDSRRLHEIVDDIALSLECIGDLTTDAKRNWSKVKILDQVRKWLVTAVENINKAQDDYRNIDKGPDAKCMHCGKEVPWNDMYCDMCLKMHAGHPCYCGRRIISEYDDMCPVCILSAKKDPKDSNYNACYRCDVRIGPDRAICENCLNGDNEED